MIFRLVLLAVIALAGLVLVQSAKAGAIIDNSTPEDPASLDASSGNGDPSGWTDAAAQTQGQIDPAATTRLPKAK